MEKTITLPEWQEIVNNVCLWDYGTEKTHEELADLIFLKPLTQKYRNVMSMVNKKLIEHGKMLKSVRGVGYLVVSPDEYLKESLSYQKKAVKNYDTSYKILENAPVEDMSAEAKSKHKVLYERSTILQAMLNGGLKQSKKLQTNKIYIRGGNQ